MNNDLVFVTSEPQPEPRWFRALTLSGKPAGLGFRCPVCAFGYPHDAPDRVFHCGAWEKAPLITALLPTRSPNGNFGLPPRVIPIGTW